MMKSTTVETISLWRSSRDQRYERQHGAGFTHFPVVPLLQNLSEKSGWLYNFKEEKTMAKDAELRWS